MSTKTSTNGNRVCNALFVDSGSGWGGTATYLYNLLRSVNRDKINPVVLFGESSDAPNIRNIERLHIPVHFLPKLKFQPPVRKNGDRRYLDFARLAVGRGALSLPVLKVLIKHRIDVVFLNNDVFNHLPTMMAAKLSGVPVICRKAAYGRGRLLQRMLSRYVDIYVAECEATKNDLMAHNIQYKRVEMSYLGIDLSRYEAAPAASLLTALEVPDGAVVLGSIARFEVGKGQPELIQAVCELMDRRDDIVLLLVGDFVDEGVSPMEGLRRGVPARHKERIKFLGWREDIPELLSIIDIFVHCPTTYIEGLPLCCLEAVASGKPMIVSLNGGLPEVVHTGYNGLVIPSGDISRLTDALLQLIDSAELRRDMGANSRALAKKLFDIQGNAVHAEKMMLATMSR